MPPAEAPPPPQGLEGKLSIFDTIGGSIDSLVDTVKAIPGAIKKAAYYTYYTAKAGLGLAAGVALANISPLLAGAAITTYQSLILPAGIALGTHVSNKLNKKETTFKQMANEIAVGGLLGGFLHHVFATVTGIGNVVGKAYGNVANYATRVGLGLAQIPLFLSVHEYLNRALIKGHEPKNFRERMAQLKGPMKWIVPLVGLNYLTPQAYQMPAAAGISTLYGAVKGDNKKEEKPEAQPLQMPPGYQMPQTRAA